MPQIIPIRDLRDTSKLSQMCNSSKEPIYITRNGYGDMVIMSMAAYEEKMFSLEMHESIMAGKKQADNGELIDGKLAMAELGQNYAK